MFGHCLYIDICVASEDSKAGGERVGFVDLIGDSLGFVCDLRVGQGTQSRADWASQEGGEAEGLREAHCEEGKYLKGNG